METDFLAVGVNAAGFYALEALAELAPGAKITGVNGESVPPYKRTQVNKLFFPERLSLEECLLAPESWYRERDITLLQNCRGRRIRPEEHLLELEDGRTIRYGRLLLAVGADPWVPEGEIFRQGRALRTFQDALQINSLLSRSRRVLIYGTGVEAVETAAQARERGLEVILAGRGESLLSRRFSPFFRNRIRDLLLEKGVAIRFGVEQKALSVKEGQFFPGEAGTDPGADLFLYSLGVRPRVELAREAGLETGRGILVNSRMETSLPDIFAAGDCCRVRGKEPEDLWHAAQEQGRIAAAAMTGQPVVPGETRHRMKLEPFGRFFFSLLPPGGTEDPECRAVSSPGPDGGERIFYFRKGRLAGVEMEGDKGRAKLYEEGVNQGWERARVEEELQLTPELP